MDKVEGATRFRQILTNILTPLQYVLPLDVERNNEAKLKCMQIYSYYALFVIAVVNPPTRINIYTFGVVRECVSDPSLHPLLQPENPKEMFTSKLPTPPTDHCSVQTIDVVAYLNFPSVRSSKEEAVHILLDHSDMMIPVVVFRNYPENWMAGDQEVEEGGCIPVGDRLVVVEQHRDAYSEGIVAVVVVV